MTVGDGRCNLHFSFSRKCHIKSHGTLFPTQGWQRYICKFILLKVPMFSNEQMTICFAWLLFHFPCKSTNINHLWFFGCCTWRGTKFAEFFIILRKYFQLALFWSGIMSKNNISNLFQKIWNWGSVGWDWPMNSLKKLCHWYVTICLSLQKHKFQVLNGGGWLMTNFRRFLIIV
jgi:hypothetical protein